MAVLTVTTLAADGGGPDAASKVNRAMAQAIVQGDSPVGVDPSLCQAMRHFDQLGGRFLFSPVGTLAGVDLTVERMSVSDDDLRRLTSLPALEILKVAGGTVTNRSVAAIVRHRSLRVLALNSVQIDATGLAQFAELPHLQSLRIRQASDLTDADLVCLERFPSLRYLELIEDRFSDRGMSAVARVEPLRLLDLRGNVEITHAGIRSLAPLKSLVALRLGSPSIDDDAMAVIADLAGVRRLTIDHAAVTDVGLSQLAKLPLEELVLTSCFQIGDTSLLTIAQFDRLATLSCRDMFLSATGLAAVGRLERLHTLRLNDLVGLDDTCLAGLIRGVTGRAAAAVPATSRDDAESNAPRPARLSKLARLELRGAEITTAGVTLVATIGSLQHLNLAGCQIDDRGVAQLTRLKELCTLDLSGNHSITDAAAERLGCMVSLQQLNVAGTSITPMAAARLRAELPQCTIRADDKADGAL